MTLLKKLKRLFGKPSIQKISLSSQGCHYDLKAIYNEVNAEYFENKLNLPITWSGSPKRKARYQRRLGSYNYRTQTIRIHRLMDHPQFPSYFLSFVVYHEMLHHVCPPEKGKRGRRRVHHEKFKVLEKQFRDYALVKKWEKENLKMVLHGRS